MNETLCPFAPHKEHNYTFLFGTSGPLSNHERLRLPVFYDGRPMGGGIATAMCIFSLVASS